MNRVKYERACSETIGQRVAAITAAYVKAFGERAGTDAGLTAAYDRAVQLDVRLTQGAQQWMPPVPPTVAPWLVSA